MQNYIIGIIDLLLQIPKRNRFVGNLKRSMESRCESASKILHHDRYTQDHATNKNEGSRVKSIETALTDTIFSRNLVKSFSSPNILSWQAPRNVAHSNLFPESILVHCFVSFFHFSISIYCI